MKSIFAKIILVVLLLVGCAGRQIDITDSEGNVIGECVAGFDWHFYGLQDSIDYILHLCAKDSIEKGYTISDKSLLERDFTLPKPPEGKSWNKKLAMHHFKKGDITEQKLGYVLAAIEHEYIVTSRAAEVKLTQGEISKVEFEQIISDARYAWLGE
jgi:hypothetical protein